MIALSEFQRYLQSILDVSREGIQREVRDRYIPTLAELPLQVQTCASSKTDSQEQQKERREQFAVLEGLRKYAPEHVLLLGKPGSGKSTTLRRLLWEEAGRCLEAIKQGHSEIPPIPILIELHGLSGSVFAAIQEKLGWWLDLDEKTVKALLRDRRLLPLLDGLNELPDEKAWLAVDQFKQVCADLKVSLIITTRELGSGLVQGIAKKLEMLPLTETQMREFVQKRLPETGGELWRQIQGRLRELAETPLLLKLLCDVFEQNEEIPKNRGDLFRKEFARRYEEFKPERIRNVSKESRLFARDLLSYLAFTMVQGEPHTDSCKPSASWITISKTQAERILASFLAGDRTPSLEDTAKAKEWLEDLLEWHLLQVASDRDRIEFHHQLFQEYYAAEHLLSKLAELSDDELKYYYLNYLKWTEVIVLMLALIDEQDFGGHGREQTVRVVKLALEADSKFPAVDLMLAARLAGELKIDFQKPAVDLIVGLKIPRLLKTELLGKTRSEYAIPVLSELIKDKSSYVRWLSAKWLGEIGSKIAVLPLSQALNDTNVNVCQVVASALARCKDASASSTLLRALNEAPLHIRRRVAYALAEVGNEQALEMLIRDLADEDYDVRRNAAYALGGIPTESSVIALAKAMDDKDEFVQQAAIYALAEIGNDLARNALINALSHKDNFVRIMAAEALSAFGDKDALAKFINAFDYEAYFNRNKGGYKFACKLAEDESESALVEINKALQKKDFFGYDGIIDGLAEVGKPNLLTTLWNFILAEDEIDLMRAVLAIQSRYGFYNYKITQSLPPIKNMQGGSQNIYYFPAASKVQVFEQVDKFINHNNSQEQTR